MKIRSALNSEDVKRALEALGQNKGRPDYLLIFKLMAFEGFKIGEIVGTGKRRRVNDKWVPKPQTLSGMRIEDLIENGIRIKPREEEPETRRFKYPELLQELRVYVGERKRGRIFHLITSDHRVRQITKEYCGPKHANLSWSDLIRPQMFTDFARRMKDENLMELLGFELTTDQLRELIKKGEGLDLEFKRDLTGKHQEFCESMVSFANLHGGRILIGVENSGLINGVPDSELGKIDDQVTSMSHSYCEPFVPHTLKVVPINNTHVVVVQIAEGIDKPYWLKEKGPMIRAGPHHQGARERVMTRQETEQAFRGFFQRTSG